MLSLIPEHELVKDLYDTLIDIELCKTALKREIQSYVTEGEHQSVLERLQTNDNITKIITDELNRRTNEGLLPLFAKDILQFAMHRGLKEPHFAYDMAYGWYMACSDREQTSLLWDICSECKIGWGGGSTCRHQIKPEHFVLPDLSTITSTPNPEELMGDLYGKEN